MSDKEELIKYLNGSQLPALSQSAMQVIELSRDPDNGPQEYAKPISADPGLTAQILRFVNSSFFGLSHKIVSVPLALTLVSVRTIRNFILWNGLFATFPNPCCGSFSLITLFQDALRRAVFARNVAEHYTRIDAEEAFTCALMQDIAVPLLVQNWRNEYAKMFKSTSTGHVRLSKLEREVMGWEHAEAGAILAEGWKLGETVNRAVSKHIDETPAHIHTCEPTLNTITALSALLPKISDREWFEVLNFVDAFRRMFGRKLADISTLIDKTDTITNQLTGLINKEAIPKSLNEFWQETLNGNSCVGDKNDPATEEQLDEYFTQAAMQPQTVFGPVWVGMTQEPGFR